MRSKLGAVDWLCLASSARLPISTSCRVCRPHTARDTRYWRVYRATLMNLCFSSKSYSIPSMSRQGFPSSWIHDEHPSICSGSRTSISSRFCTLTETEWPCLQGIDPHEIFCDFLHLHRSSCTLRDITARPRPNRMKLISNILPTTHTRCKTLFHQYESL